MRISKIGRRRFHLRLAMVVPGEWWDSNAASWMRAKTVWTTKAAAKWVALAVTKSWQGLLLVAKVEKRRQRRRCLAGPARRPRRRQPERR